MAAFRVIGIWPAPLPTALDPMAAREMKETQSVTQTAGHGRSRDTARSFVVEVLPGVLLKNSPRGSREMLIRKRRDAVCVVVESYHQRHPDKKSACRTEALDRGHQANQ